MAKRRPQRGGSKWIVTRIVLLFACPLLGICLSAVYPQAPIALAIVSVLSVAAAIAECVGFLPCPFSLICVGLFFMQGILLMFSALVSLGPVPFPVPERPAAPAGFPAQLGDHGRPEAAAVPGAKAAVPGTERAMSGAGRAVSGTGRAVPGTERAAKAAVSGTERATARAPGDLEAAGAPREVADAAARRARAEGVPPPPDLRGRSRISVVLPCAEEGQYAVKTALKVVDRTPPDILEEVIVVDDGSKHTMEAAFNQAGVGAGARDDKKIRILRHRETLGLMVAKKTGGDAARGDIIAFFDCHVSPQTGYHEEIRRLIEENPRRMVVPAITDLDIDTWEETAASSVNTKCYLTWNADFDWFEDESPYVPVMSGGLLALSAYWWNLTGGYDSNMRGWGGENLDQSLRAWLCGGEIMRAKSSRVAHMWRTQDKRTAAHYHPVGSPMANKMHVVTAWYGAFKRLYRGGGDASRPIEASIRRVQERLGCKPFVHFLHRFRDIYVDGAVIPLEVFTLRDRATGQCLTLHGQVVRASPCMSGRARTAAQVFHWANRVHGRGRMRGAGRPAKHPNIGCCSGLRHWRSDQCLDYGDSSGIHMYFCDVTGQNQNQQYAFVDGRIVHGDGRCLVVSGATTQLRPCRGLADGEALWEQVDPFEPEEAGLYRGELRKEGLSDPAFAPAGRAGRA